MSNKKTIRSLEIPHLVIARDVYWQRPLTPNHLEQTSLQGGTTRYGANGLVIPNGEYYATGLVRRGRNRFAHADLTGSQAQRNYGGVLHEEEFAGSNVFFLNSEHETQLFGFNPNETREALDALTANGFDDLAVILEGLERALRRA